MKLDVNTSEIAKFHIKNINTGQVTIDNSIMQLTQNQISYISANPYANYTYARFLENKYNQLGIANMEITTEMRGALNGRPFQYKVSPDFNLLTINKYPLQSRPDYIVPIEKNAPIGQYNGRKILAGIKHDINDANFQSLNNINNNLALNMKGTYYMKQGEFKIAEDLFLQAMSQQPENIAAYINMAIINYIRNRIKTANFYLNEGLKIDPDDQSANRLKSIIDNLQQTHLLL